ncbi:MAG: peptidoglycan DD-metalloendopeptidase family protein [Campylobacterota bacterium]|nr:peptidoglycan DD-metalloendopeptidase family protein [Campylobacterota bacterium]
MIKTLFVLLILNSILYANINEKITKTSTKIKGYNSKQSTITSNMNKTAKQILKEEKTIKKQQKTLVSLKKELNEKNGKYKDNISTLNELQKEQIKLNTQQEKLKKSLIEMISKNISLSQLSSRDKHIDYKSVISSEVLKSMQKVNNKQIDKLKDVYKDKSKKISLLDTKSSKLKKSIFSIESKRDKLKKLKEKNIKDLAKLKKDKKRYKTSLNKVIKQRISLKETLAQLNIIKEEEIQKRERNKIKLSSKSLPSVKQIGSSYQKNKTKKYRGKKTISPLNNYSVVKKYGTYTDPVYGIKIFNESVMLKPKSKHAKVKNVLNGKVILAKKTSLLDNVVIVQHANKMHTIYAHLDKIAPNIKKGKKVKKGHILGRVNNELMFEVTQKNYHINPLELIK